MARRNSALKDFEISVERTNRNIDSRARCMATIKKCWMLLLPNRFGSEQSFPCSGGFTIQCAIRMGIALEANGIDTSTFHGVRCWSGDSPSHILRAEEVANWLAEHSNPDLGRLTRYTRRKKSSEFMGKRGILFAKLQLRWLGSWRSYRFVGWYSKK